MLFELKEYQESTLNSFSRWYEELEKARMQSESDIEVLESNQIDVPADVRNFPKKAWESLDAAGEIASTAGPYVDRTDEASRPIPHVCLKIPTGGGKTLLAAAALERVHKQTGLTLWITPTKAIYQQTMKALKDREHPYREMLDRASGGRIKLLEKEDKFTAADVASYMCIMLLMLPATNRQKGKEFLRMFRDSGRYPTLFPDTDDLFGDARLLQEFPDLDRESEKEPGKEGPVKHSLFNAFKMLKPAVVLDEAHKAYGAKSKKSNEEFVKSVNRLDPSLVIELSATPNSGISNLLVDIGGQDLHSEEMIKLPVQVTSFPNTEWENTLAEAHDLLQGLSADAVALQDNEGRYIRPIAVVRVERTGKDQRDGELIHAEDVREYLTRTLGVPDNEVAVKSAERDEISGIDLLSEFTPVRWIITKAALMEGWDCPFAYLLVMLDNITAQKAVTQLVGRVMRQPGARLTGVETLDQCYVYCWNAKVRDAVDQVRKGLESEGLTGLGSQVKGEDDREWQKIEVARREEFKDRQIFLPLVLHRDGAEWVELDYQSHVLPCIDWEAIKIPPPEDMTPEQARIETATVGLGEAYAVFHPDQEIYIDKTLQIAWFARRLADIVPNPWQACRLAEEMAQRWHEADFTEDDIHDRRSHISQTLREYVTKVVDEQSQQVFQTKLSNGEIAFDLESSRPSLELKNSYHIDISEQDNSISTFGKQAQISLFNPVFEREFDSDPERRFAFYLDERKALEWWHRVAVRQQGDYYIRGWRKNRVWPDFIAMTTKEKGKVSLLVFETKGKDRKDTDDTKYKQKLFSVLEKTFNVGRMKVTEGPAEGTFRMVFEDEPFPDLNGLLSETRI